MKLLRALWILASAVLLLAACGGGKVPYIDSFVAASTSVLPGASTTLTAEFGGGDGIIEPGHIAVSSGVPVTVSPTSTTTYTLTVSDGDLDESDSVTITLRYEDSWTFDAHDADWTLLPINGAGQAVATDNTGSLVLVATPGADAGGACSSAGAQLIVRNGDYNDGVHSAVQFLFDGVNVDKVSGGTPVSVTIVYGSQLASFEPPEGTGYSLRVEWGGSADKLKFYDQNDTLLGEVDKGAAGAQSGGVSVLVKACPEDLGAASFSTTRLSITAR